MEVALIINVSKRKYAYQRGPLGTYTVPAAEDGEFGLLIVRPDGEVQDVGGKIRRRNEAIPARKLAEDIVGGGADTLERRGFLICAAEPDIPKALEKAESEEHHFLADHPGELRSRVNPINKIREFRTVDEPEIRDKKIKLSKRVEEARAEFHEQCRKLVTKQEIATAKKFLVEYYQFLISEGDRFWSREATRGEVNEHHKTAARELGYEPPWCYTPAVRQDCPGCGEKVKVGIAICPKCNAVLDEKQARKLYPERFTAVA